MDTNLGRANLSWDKTTWDNIDAGVLAEVYRVRVAQKVFPCSMLDDGALTGNVVQADQFDPESMTIAEGQTLPLIEISVDFALTEGQVSNEGSLHTGRTLARLAAKTLALAEDEVLFQGSDVDLGGLGPTVKVRNLDLPNNTPNVHGLFGVADATIEVNLDNDEDEDGVVSGLFAAVTRGIARLIANGQPAPYALFLETSVYADAFAPLEDSGLATTADLLMPLLEGRLYCTGALPAGAGLLVCLAGDPTILSIAQEAVTEFTQKGAQDGDYHFRVLERLQFVARDHRALLRLQVNHKAGAAVRARPAQGGTGA